MDSCEKAFFFGVPQNECRENHMLGEIQPWAASESYISIVFLMLGGLREKPVQLANHQLGIGFCGLDRAELQPRVTLRPFWPFRSIYKFLEPFVSLTNY